MEQWDINCVECGRFILTEQKEEVTGNIKCVAGSYDNGFYDEKKMFSIVKNVLKIKI